MSLRSTHSEDGLFLNAWRQVRFSARWRLTSRLGHGWRVNLRVSRGFNISTLANIRKQIRTRDHESQTAVLELTMMLLGLLDCWLQAL